MALIAGMRADAPMEEICQLEKFCANHQINLADGKVLSYEQYLEIELPMMLISGDFLSAHWSTLSFSMN